MYVPLALLLIPPYRVFGLIVASIVAGFSSILYGLHIVSRDFRSELVNKHNVIILGAFSIPAVVARLAVTLLTSSTLVRLLLGVSAHLTFLLIMIPLTIGGSEVLELIEIAKRVRLLSFIGPRALLLNPSDTRPLKLC